jgi:SAM-dependent methyltransferase
VLERELLVEFVAAYAFQPATALWRAIELATLIELSIVPGLGIDIGCGDGKLTEILARHISLGALVGVDPDPKETEAARSRNFYRAVHTTGADHIPEPDGRFDYAVSNSVLEHIPDLDSVLAEVARVLRPGGLFYLTVPHAGFHAQLSGPIAPWESRDRYLARLDRRLAHLRYPSEAEWRGLLDRHGFTTEIASFYLERRQLQRWETLSRFTAGVLDTMSGGRKHPIEMQRGLGLRQAQNAFSWPRPCADLLARLLDLRMPPAPGPLTEATTGCVAIRCRKR